jgi:phosphatidylserine/phosphatidylglycerophosphate/cardiolipin synthase-like enzyme
MISVGRFSGKKYGASDTAIKALISSAEKSLHIAQQALFYPTNTTYTFFNQIFISLREALNKGVKVHIVVSRTQDGNQTASQGYTSASADKIYEVFRRNLRNTDLEGRNIID